MDMWVVNTKYKAVRLHVKLFDLNILTLVLFYSANFIRYTIVQKFRDGTFCNVFERSILLTKAAFIK